MLWRTFGTSSSCKGKCPPSDDACSHWIPVHHPKRALAGKAPEERKVHRVAFMIAAIPTSKLPHGLSLRSVETCGSGSVFATRTSRFNKTQGAFAPSWSTSTCSTFSFLSVLGKHVWGSAATTCLVAGRGHLLMLHVRRLLEAHPAKQKDR